MIFSLAITGPTASGKTALSITLAERLGAEIISCDSMQIYRGMDIGTAKATKEERALVPHHLIDFLPPSESYSVEAYREAAIDCARSVSDRGRLPIFVGGTGLYIDSLMRRGASDLPESDPAYREALIASVGDGDVREALWQRLYSVDPESAKTIHKNNQKRVIRALEIYDKTGRKKSDLDRESQSFTPEVFVGMITIDFHDRELLYRRVDERVDAMMREGLLFEVEGLYRSGALGHTASQAIGYKELIEYLEGKTTLEGAVENLKLASRRYAKRQLTWFRHERDARVIYADDGVGIKNMNLIIDEALAHTEQLRCEYEIKKGMV